MIPATIYCDNCGAANRAQAAFCTACGKRLQAAKPIQPVKPGNTNAAGPINRTTGTTATTSSSLTGMLTMQHVIKQRYRVLAMVGKGGFGAVYKVADTQFGNRVLAVKEMSQSNLSPQELVEATDSFKREAMLLANLIHPNLPRIYEQFSETGRWYLVMDFIEGQTLEEFLNKAGGKLPVEKVLDIGIQLCSVLDYLHTRQPPIIFRDLKPANIMLAANGHIYLIDFGIARHFKPGQVKDTTALGSSGYAAPEQYGRQQTTQRADIYALGATLHQMLSGNDPSDSPFHFAPLQLGANPVLAGLQTLITQMLDMDVNKRPPGAAPVREALQRIAAQYGAATTNPLRSTLPQGYHPFPPATPVRVVQQAQSGQQGQLLPPMPPPVRTSTPQGQAQTPPVVKTPKPPQPKPQNLLFTCKGHSSRATAVTWARNGTRLASAGFDKTARVWNAANGNAMQTYIGHSDRVETLIWSPSGTHLASAGDDRAVHVWDAATGTSTMIYNGHSDHILSLAWSPDGTRIASASADKTVQVWDVATGRNVYTYRGHTAPVHAVVWSPDGKRIASGGEDRVVQVWEIVKDSRSNPLTSLFFANKGTFTYRGHTGRVNALAWSADGRRIASASSDKSMQVWDALSNKLIFVYRHRASALNAVSWSLDNRRVAFGGNDKTVQVWDVIARNMLCLYHGHSGYITGLAWSPDGTRVASSSVDKTIQIWRPM